MIAWVRRLFGRRKKEAPELTFREEMYALLDKGEFNEVSNRTRNIRGRGGVGNAYYEYCADWRRDRANTA